MLKKSKKITAFGLFGSFIVFSLSFSCEAFFGKSFDRKGIYEKMDVIIESYKEKRKDIPAYMIHDLDGQKELQEKGKAEIQKISYKDLKSEIRGAFKYCFEKTKKEIPCGFGSKHSIADNKYFSIKVDLPVSDLEREKFCKNLIKYAFLDELLNLNNSSDK
ncbi:hypothetical protein KAH94_06165 [bacterium]|nr:hypothetical protein [bacterium]